MVDILSVTTGVFALLGTCLKVSIALKDFYDGAAIADARIKSLLTDVESFAQVLQLMKDTLEQEKTRSSFQTTGHIGNHWTNVASSIDDGQLTLSMLHKTLEKAGKTVKLLDGSRKHIRLKGAMEEILMFQQQIQVCRDTLHLSLQTVVVWNQITFQESADQILINLDELHHAIRRLALDINSRMGSLEERVDSTSKHEELVVLANLRNCVQSAASVVSSASTSLGIDHSEHFSVTYGSEFEDCFPSQPSPTMLRWISSNTVYEFSENQDAETNRVEEKNVFGKPINTSDVTDELHNSDSDSDLEHEIVQALAHRGKEKLASGDTRGAERLFRNCLSRIPSSGPVSSLLRSSRTEVIGILVEIYQKQEKWAEAQTLLIQKMALGSRGTSVADEEGLFDMLTLVEVLLRREAYSESLLYGRRALKGYRKLGRAGHHGVERALELLVETCHADGNADDEEAYSIVLAKHLSAKPVAGVVGKAERLGLNPVSGPSNIALESKSGMNAEGRSYFVEGDGLPGIFSAGAKIVRPSAARPGVYRDQESLQHSQQLMKEYSNETSFSADESLEKAPLLSRSKILLTTQKLAPAEDVPLPSISTSELIDSQGLIPETSSLLPNTTTSKVHIFPQTSDPKIMASYLQSVSYITNEIWPSKSRTPGSEAEHQEGKDKNGIIDHIEGQGQVDHGRADTLEEGRESHKIDSAIGSESSCSSDSPTRDQLRYEGIPEDSSRSVHVGSEASTFGEHLMPAQISFGNGANEEEFTVPHVDDVPARKPSQIVFSEPTASQFDNEEIQQPSTPPEILIPREMLENFTDLTQTKSSLNDVAATAPAVPSDSYFPATDKDLSSKGRQTPVTTVIDQIITPVVPPTMVDGPLSTVVPSPTAFKDVPQNLEESVLKRQSMSAAIDLDFDSNLSVAQASPQEFAGEPDQLHELAVPLGASVAEDGSDEYDPFRHDVPFGQSAGLGHAKSQSVDSTRRYSFLPTDENSFHTISTSKMKNIASNAELDPSTASKPGPNGIPIENPVFTRKYYTVASPPWQQPSIFSTKHVTLVRNIPRKEISARGKEVQERKTADHLESLVNTASGDFSTSENMEAAAVSTPVVRLPLFTRRSYELEPGQKKIVLIGDGGVGKTALAQYIRDGTFAMNFKEWESLDPQYFTLDEHSLKYPSNASLVLADIPGCEECDIYRDLELADAHMLFMCFAISDPQSAENILERWMPNIESYKRLPCVLLGLKGDLRNDEYTIKELSKTKNHPVTYEEGIKLGNKIGALLYLELSSKVGIESDFLTGAIQPILFPEHKHKKRLSLQRLRELGKSSRNSETILPRRGRR